MWTFTAEKTNRLDRFLREQVFTGAEWMSRQSWDRALEQGKVRVDGRITKKGGASLAPGASVSVDLPELGLVPAARSARLHYASEARDFAVFAKDPGTDTYPLVPWENDTLANEIARFVEEHGWMNAATYAALASPPLLEGGLVQRLDRDTSGLVVSAFTPAAKQRFRQLFSGAAEKTYLALVQGDPLPAEGEHRLFFRGGSEAARVQAERAPRAGAQEATLSLRTLAREGGSALVEVRTRQGYRHVVRAGMAALGAPLVGDKLYGGAGPASFHQLHAADLRLPGLPDFWLPPPQSFLDCARALGLNLKDEAGVAPSH